MDSRGELNKEMNGWDDKGEGEMTEKEKLVEETEKCVETVLLSKIKFIEKYDHTYLGCPADLIKLLAQAIVDLLVRKGMVK